MSLAAEYRKLNLRQQEQYLWIILNEKRVGGKD
jgi:hypothetical protein